MIQFKRGMTENWRLQKQPLADGQPGYDKKKHKIKVGDGTRAWADLPYASGLSAEEILDSEKAAKTKYAADSEDKTLFTYGTDSPDKDTVGQVYLQHYDAEPEADYVVSYGIDSGWIYQKWRSGVAKCYGKLTVETPLSNQHEKAALYYSDKFGEKKYPIKFIETPYETATLQSHGPAAWLVSNSANTNSTTGKYCIMCADNWSSGSYDIIFRIEGRWR